MNSQGESSDSGAAAALRALERFVVENDDLLELESLIGRFNVFDALGIARREVSHSHFLSFLLDPAESHGAGPLFLDALLKDLLRQSPTELRPFSPIELDGAQLRGVEVKREWRNIDLLIVCKEPRFVVVIENKIDSVEHSDQLRRYQQTIRDYYPDAPTLFVFLSPSGDDASEERWTPYCYGDIHRVFSRARDANENAISEEVLVFVKHYLNLLRTQFMDDEKLSELCQRIYKNHRQALDIIWKYTPPMGSDAQQVLSEILKSDDRWEVTNAANGGLNVFPLQWYDWLPLCGDHYQFYVNLRARESKITFVPWVGSMDDANLYERVVMELREKGPECGFNNTQAHVVYPRGNRIASRETLVIWSDEEELKEDAFRHRIESKLNDLYSRLEKLAAILRPMVAADHA